MQNSDSADRTVPTQYVRNSRAFRQFKNPPQPHMCIQDTIKNTTEKLFINVLGWQKIANPKQYSDPIPLYGGMQITQGCGPNTNRPPLLVFAVMVNPDILKANGKNALNLSDRDALVSLLCDFVEAMNPGLLLTRNPIILKDRDLAGELKDVWLAVQKKREREKEVNQDVMYKVYDIDGIGNEDVNIEDKSNGIDSCNQKDNNSPNKSHYNDTKSIIKSSKQILLNAGQKSEFDAGMNNQNLSNRDNRCTNSNEDSTYCTQVYRQIMSTREYSCQNNEVDQIFLTNESTKPSTSFRKDWSPTQDKSGQWDEFAKRNIATIKHNEADARQQCFNNSNSNNPVTNGKYSFFPVFNNKEEDPDIMNSKEQVRTDDKSKIILDPMQKLVLHSTDKHICDNKTSALSSLSS